MLATPSSATDWQIVDANRTPHWLTCEFARAMHRAEPVHGRLRQDKIAFRRFLARIDQAVAKRGLGDAQYLTPTQWRELNDRYREEAAWLERTCGVREPPSATPVTEERPFLPSMENAPSAFRDLIRRRLASREAKNLPDHIITAARAVLEHTARPAI